LQGVLRETLDQDVGGAIAHFFNCLVGPESLNASVEGSSGSSEKAEEKVPSVSDDTSSFLLTVAHGALNFMETTSTQSICTLQYLRGNVPRMWIW